jgi:hypothetical protein
MTSEIRTPRRRGTGRRVARGEERLFTHLGALAGALLVAIVGVAAGHGFAPWASSAAEAASTAKPLAQFAPKSADAAIKAVSLCSSETNGFDPRRVGTAFRQGVKNIVVWYRWEGSPSGRRLDVRWSREGKVVLTQGENIDEASGESSWTLAMSSGSPLPPGSYKVELIEDGKTVTAIPFQIK